MTSATKLYDSARLALRARGIPIRDGSTGSKILDAIYALQGKGTPRVHDMIISIEIKRWLDSLDPPPPLPEHPFSIFRRGELNRKDMRAAVERARGAIVRGRSQI